MEEELGKAAGRAGGTRVTAPSLDSGLGTGQGVLDSEGWRGNRPGETEGSAGPGLENGNDKGWWWPAGGGWDPGCTGGALELGEGLRHTSRGRAAKAQTQETRCPFLEARAGRQAGAR